MAQNIVDTLFGARPYEVDEARYGGLEKFANNRANMNLGQKASQQFTMGGGMLGRELGGALGMVDPMQQEAQMREQALTNIDLSSSDAILRTAMQTQDPRLKVQLTMMAQQRKAQEQRAALDSAEVRRKEAQTERELALAEKATKGELESKYMTPVQKLMAARDSLPEGHPNRAVLDDAIRKETMIAAQERTIVSEIVDPKDPNRMLRIDANKYQGGSLGDQGVIGVSGKEPTAAKKEEQVGQGRGTVSSLVSTLQGYYDELLKGGGIVSTKRGPVANIMSRTGSTGVGQTLGGAVGTKNQEMRDSIKQQRPLLLQAIKQATGMSAKQMDSNVELKMYLAAATDPEIGYEANVAALKKLDELYGISEGKSPGKQEDAAPKYEASTPAEVRALYKAGRIPKDDAKTILKDMESRGLF